MIPIYSKVLSAIKKTLQELVEEYQDIGKSLWNLVEDQERNIVQLERIGAMIEQRWGLKKENKEEDRDNEKGSKNGPGKSQKKGTLLFASC